MTSVLPLGLGGNQPIIAGILLSRSTSLDEAAVFPDEAEGIAVPSPFN